MVLPYGGPRNEVPASWTHPWRRVFPHGFSGRSGSDVARVDCRTNHAPRNTFFTPFPQEY